MKNKIMFLLIGMFLISFSSAWSEDNFNNSLSTENLIFSGDENITRWLSVPENSLLTSATMNLSGKVWQHNSTIISGLTSSGSKNNPSIFQKDSTWYLINGEYGGNWFGHNWTGSTWQSDSTIISGLTDVGTYSTPSIFQKDSTWYLISGTNVGTFVGYNWTGSTWQSDSTIISGLTDVGWNSNPSIFQKDSTWYLISGSSTGVFVGYNWTGSTWQSDFNIISGLNISEIFDNKYSSPSIFQKDSTWYIISGKNDGNWFGHNWTGSTWQSDSTIISGLTDVGWNSNPSIFQKDSIWYLISGESDGDWNGWNFNIITNSYIQINNTKIWNYTGEFDSTAQTLNFAEIINNYIETVTAVAGYYLIPFIFHSDTVGILEYLALVFNNEGFTENSQTYSSETAEGNIETFKINFSYDSNAYSTVEAKLIYNNTEYIGAKISGTGNTVVYSTDIEIPSVNADENKTFYWNILIGTTYQNSTSYNQTIYNLALDNCAVYTNAILNLTIRDEEIQNKINASAVGVELEIAVNIYSSDRNTLVLNLSNQYATNPTAICLNRNLTAEASYSMDSIIRYKSTGYANEYYNIVKFVLTNETPTQNINLYNLNLTDSTEFQLTFIGGDYIAVENALVYVERQYIDENTFKTVELPLTDTNGQTILHLVKNDIIYNFIIMKDGVVLGSFNNMIAFCEDYSIGDCKINLNAFDSVESVFDSDDFYGITFTAPQYDETLDRVTFNFQSIDGSTKTVLMEVTRNDIFGNRSICNSTLVSSGGTIICDIDPNLDESVLRINIYVDGSKIIVDSVQLDSSNYGEAGYLVFFIMAITIILMFSGSKTGILFGIILTFAGAIGLNMISSEIIGIGASGLWLLVIVIIAIWKLNKERIQ